jgi:hypothetical protein
MKADLKIPNLSDLSKISIHFAVCRVFLASGPKSYAQYALIMNYIRLVDLAISEYQDGRDLALRYWEPGESLGAMIRAAGYFEACLSNLKRALNHLKIIRSHKGLPKNLKDRLPRQLKVLHGSTEGQITAIRDAIQHLERDIQNLDVKQDNPICLVLEFEKLVLGNYSISYQKLSAWLKELHQCATKIHSYYLTSRT